MTSAAHRRAMRAHAKTRAAERFGVLLSRRSLVEIVAMIEAGELALIQTLAHGRNVYRMTVDESGRTCRVVYDARARSVVTFLWDAPS